MESVAEFRERARQWLDGRVPRRTAEARGEWGQGEFSVVVFHDASDEDEQALLDAYRGWHREKVAAGFGAIHIAEEFGGLGLTKAHDAAFKELEAQYDVPRDHEIISVTAKLIAPTIEEFGTPEQKSQWCRTFFQLEQFCCQLFSEPGAGSDLAGLSCKAVRDGDEWVLDGQKVWTSTARISQYGFAICRHDPDVAKHAGPDRVPRAARRARRRGAPDPTDVGRRVVQRGVPERRAGTRLVPSRRGRRRLEGRAHRARPRAGHQRLRPPRRQLRRRARCSLAISGRTDEPLVRQQLASIYTSAKVRDWTKARSAATAKATGSSGPGGSIGKLLWTVALGEITEVVSHLLGPALTADTGEWGTFGWNEHVLGAPGYRIAGGSDEIQRNIIGERVLGLPGEPRVDRDITFAELARQQRK